MRIPACASKPSTFWFARWSRDARMHRRIPDLLLRRKESNVPLDPSMKHVVRTLEELQRNDPNRYVRCGAPRPCGRLARMKFSEKSSAREVGLSETPARNAVRNLDICKESPARDEHDHKFQNDKRSMLQGPSHRTLFIFYARTSAGIGL